MQSNITRRGLFATLAAAVAAIIPASGAARPTLRISRRCPWVFPPNKIFTAGFDVQDGRVEGKVFEWRAGEAVATGKSYEDCVAHGMFSDAR